jgi:ribosomal protein S25
MKAITPTAVAIRFNLKISVAKRMLTELESKGVIEFVTRSKNLKVYKMAGES